MEGIQVHEYGAHIFHTSDKKIWDYVHQFATFNRYTNTPVANFNGEIYNLPFNMNTFNKLWGVVTPQEAEAKIAEQRAVLGDKEPENLVEQAISLVGEDIYYKLIKGYTEKQWGRSATELPAFIIRRLPVRYTYDNNYFNDTYQGIPIGGYTKMIEAMLDHENIEVELNVDFFAKKDEYLSSGAKIVFTGMIDEFFDYELGTLEYRSLRFETEVVDVENYQGNAVVNYTDRETPYTRIIKHKHLLELRSYANCEVFSSFRQFNLILFPLIPNLIFCHQNIIERSCIGSCLRATNLYAFITIKRFCPEANSLLLS